MEYTRLGEAMIEVITMVYNEEKLLPLFLDHYKWADRVHVIIDEDTTDNSMEIAQSRHMNTSVYSYKFPDMMDDELKVKVINHIAKNCTDWIIVVDADEFIFHPEHRPLKHYLEHECLGNAVNVAFYEVFRNRKENDLDYTQPALFQRRYGNPVIGQSYGIDLFTKPIVVKREINPVWAPGNHVVTGDKIIWSYDKLYGAHWSMADVDIAIERRIAGRKLRQSKNNLAKGLTYQHWDVKEESIRAECTKMLDAPLLF